MKYIRTKDGRIIDLTRYDNKTSPVGKAFGFITLIDKKRICDLEIFEKDIVEQTNTIEELCDEFVIFEKGNISIVSCLAEAKDRLLEYRDFDNYEPRLIGRIKVGLDGKAVAEFEEIKEGKYKGCYDWILL